MLDLELQFRHEVVTPFLRLKSRSLEHLCVQERISDVIVLAQEAATAAYHFPEAARGRAAKMVDPDAEFLRQKLSDVVDSRKHGRLSNAARQVALHAKLAYEFNDNVEFRYLGTKVLAENQRFGQFDLAETIEAFMHHICREFSITCTVAVPRPDEPFRKKITTYFTSAVVFAENVGLLTYKRQSDGALVLADPPYVEVEVIDASAPAVPIPPG
ncbi:hypothetical protein [Bradyrhizobium liaoningense]